MRRNALCDFFSSFYKIAKQIVLFKLFSFLNKFAKSGSFLILFSFLNKYTKRIASFKPFFIFRKITTRTALLILFFALSMIAKAQVNPIPKDSCTFQISLLTCAPGTDLYSIFGHTAIRVRDARRGMDIVYNYGTFDDSDPLFYLKFMRGIMRYSLSAEPYDSFMQEYTYEHRAVISQLLNLTCTEKNNLYEALRKNTLDENRLYDYHFHTDNCTTRAGRIIESNTSDSLIYKNILTQNSSANAKDVVESVPSFRDMIHEYLYKQNAYWSAFGIDLFLGAHLDKKVTNIEAIHFLPDYLMKGMDNADEGNKQMVISKQKLLDYPGQQSSSGLTPKLLFSLIAIVLAILTVLGKRPTIKKSLLIFDMVFFSVLGLLGLLMAAMWLGRVDDVCSNNMNILWALPTHILAVFFIRKNNRLKNYFLITAVIAAILAVGFGFWPQRMNPAVLPVLGIIILRAGYLYQIRKNAEKPAVQG